MSRISQAFKNKKSLIIFITGGDPDIETTENLIPEITEAGADLIEIGIPFSDPVFDGPVIQAANKRALESDTTTDKLFDMVARVKRKMQIPLLFMSYLNPINTYGKERFLSACRKTGIDGIIVPDLPFEEKDELSENCTQFGIDLISLVTPETSNERIAMIAKKAKGFLYCVSSIGVTGMRSTINTDIEKVVVQAKKFANVPCAIGFGISNPSQARDMAKIADGVIVGSAIVKIIEEHGRNCIEPVKNFIKIMKFFRIKGCSANSGRREIEK
jgi:tryptophan synthase alpha chain